VNKEVPEIIRWKRLHQFAYLYIRADRDHGWDEQIVCFWWSRLIVCSGVKKIFEIAKEYTRFKEKITNFIFNFLLKI
jgi:hypothetical protein